MLILSRIVELFATFTECVVILSVITASSTRRIPGRKGLFLLIAFSLCSTILVTILNFLDEFSYITPLVSMTFIIFVTSKILSTGSLLT